MRNVVSARRNTIIPPITRRREIFIQPPLCEKLLGGFLSGENEYGLQYHDDEYGYSHPRGDNNGIVDRFCGTSFYDDSKASPNDYQCVGNGLVADQHRDSNQCSNGNEQICPHIGSDTPAVPAKVNEEGCDIGYGCHGDPSRIDINRNSAEEANLTMGFDFLLLDKGEEKSEEESKHNDNRKYHFFIVPCKNPRHVKDTGKSKSTLNGDVFLSGIGMRYGFIEVKANKHDK